jgi:catechol 2,3-dioxygenase-like lactoylglutathione lyase family enzyme
VSIDGFISFLPTVRPAESADFYETVLGLELVLDQSACRIYRINEGAYLGVCERDAAGPTGVVTTLVTDDVDDWCERITDHGWPLRSGPEHNDRFRIYHAYLEDPDGNVLEIQRFDDPDWNA